MGQAKDGEGEAPSEEGADVAGAGKGSGSNHRILDRSKVRILLCDNDPKSSQEVLHLLSKCSYQVTPVRTARQVIDVLNAQGPDIDIILAEVDLPITKGLKMLKYVTKDKALRRIPIIMMSSQDEVSVVVKCLRLGAADYLVKPLRTNELLNLWTHMWRRRRMLGLAEKDILGYDFDLVASDPSDANTNSTTLLSDDTDEKLKMATQPEPSVSNQWEHESNASALESKHINLLENQHNVMEDGDCVVLSGGFFSCPKKTNLKIGESSAFLTYVKSSARTSNSCVSLVEGNAAPSRPSDCEENPVGHDKKCISREASESLSHGNCFAAVEKVPDMNMLPMPWELSVGCLSSSTAQTQGRNERQIDASEVPSIFPLAMHFPGMMEQNMMLPSMHMHQGSLNNPHGHSTSAVMPHYNILPHCPQLHMMPSFSYYPVNISLQGGHVPAPHLWSSTSSSSTPEAKCGRTERREAALIKFRQKRKERCFDKKIRYVNRKQLAEKRPRVRGQFVRHMNGLDVQLDGFPNANNDSEEEDEEPVSRDRELNSSPEHVTSEF